MDSDLSRLCALPGTDDLTLVDLSHVLSLSGNTAQRLVSFGHIECKKHAGRGSGRQPRVRIPRAAVVRYLVKHSTGERTVIFAAIKAQCPQYLPAVADLMPGAPALQLPSNVIPMRGPRRPKGPKGPPAEHPGQLFLFPSQASA